MSDPVNTKLCLQEICCCCCCCLLPSGGARDLHLRKSGSDANVTGGATCWAENETHTNASWGDEAVGFRISYYFLFFYFFFLFLFFLSIISLSIFLSFFLMNEKNINFLLFLLPPPSITHTYSQIHSHIHTFAHTHSFTATLIDIVY